MGTVDAVVAQIPGLKWARIEGVDLPFTEEYSLSKLSNGSTVIDSRNLVDNTWIDLEMESIILPLSVVTNSHTQIVKISMLVGDDFRVYGPQGTRIPEIPTRIVDMKQHTFAVEGEPGRVVRVESAKTLGGPWTETGAELVIPSYPTVYTKSEPAGFFRTRAVITVPY
jgi:hypothetical protein